MRDSICLDREEIVIIDGYNVMGCLGLLDKVTRKEMSFKAARFELLGRLSILRKTSDRRILVVFDGSPAATLKKRRRKRRRVKIVFTKPPQTADDFIKRVAESQRDFVITNDIALRRYLERRGVKVFPCQVLELFLVYPFSAGLGQKGEIVG